MKYTVVASIRFISSVFLGLVIFGGILSIIFYGFTVTHIEFIGDGMVAEFNEKRITGNTIFFPSEKVKKELLREYPQLSDVIIQKKFPHTIVIKPILRKPFALLVTAKASYDIDTEGNVLGLGNDLVGLPEIRVDIPTVSVGMRLIHPTILSALTFLSRSAAFLSVSSITPEEDGLSLRAVSDKTDILFTQDQPIDTVIATLQTIVTGVRIKGTMPKIIDVRFSKPVIQW